MKGGEWRESLTDLLACLVLDSCLLWSELATDISWRNFKMHNVSTNEVYRTINKLIPNGEHLTMYLPPVNCTSF